MRDLVAGLVAVVACAALTSSASAQVSTSPPRAQSALEQSHWILGRVDGLPPAVRATVHLYSTVTRHQAAQQSAQAPPGLFWAGTRIGRSETDSDGFFEVNAPAGQPARLVITAPGYGARQTWLSPVHEPLTLEAVTLPAARSLDLQITDRQGAPLSQAWIDIQLEAPPEPQQWEDRRRSRRSGPDTWTAPPLRGRVDVNGSLRLPVERDASGSVEISAPGFGPVTQKISTLRAGDTTTRVALEPVTHSYDIRVVDANQTPVADVQIHAARSGPAFATTTESGAARLRAGLNASWTLIGPSGRVGSLSRQTTSSDLADHSGPTPLVATIESHSIDVGRSIETMTTGQGEPHLPVTLGAIDGAWAQWGHSGELALSWVPGDGRSVTWIGSAPGFVTRRVETPASSLPSPLPLEPAATIVGTVQSTSATPISRARVTGFKRPVSSRGISAGSSLPTTWTRENGSFLLTQVPAGFDRLVAAHPDFLRSTPSSLDTLLPFEIRRSVVLTLSRGRIAVGQVIGADGLPIESAQVTLDVQRGDRGSGRGARRPRSTPPVASNSDGIFRIERLPGGTATLRVDAQGHAAASIPGIELPSEDGEFDLGVVTLEPEVRVEGRVVDSDGRGIADAAIRLGVPGNRRRASLPASRVTRTPSGRFVIHDLSITSDESGAFSIGELMAGEQIRIEAVHDDYQAADVMVVVPADDAVELVLEAAAVVDGQVLSPAGEPVARAAVALVPTTSTTRRDRRSSLSERSDDSGRFQVKAKPDTSYTIEASSNDWAPSEPRIVEVPAGGVRDLEIYLRSGVSLSGRVTGVDGSPLTGVLVMARSSKRARTNEQGAYHLEGLAPGTTSIVARRDDGTSRVERLELVTGENRLDISFSGGTLTGVVFTADGNPVSGAIVQLVPKGDDTRRGRLRRVSTSDNGGYRFEDVPGGAFDLQASKSTLGSSSTQSIELFDGDDASVDLYLEPRSQILGLVLGLSIDQLSQIRVTARHIAPPNEGGGESADPRRRSISRFASVDFEGRFTLEDLDPGRWEVVGQLAAEGWEVRRDSVLNRGETARVELDFTDVGDELVLWLRLDGAPLAGARVTVTGNGAPRVAETDYQGRLRLSGIDGDRATVATRVATAILREREIQLPARPAPTLEYLTGGIEISVVDAATLAPVVTGTGELRSGDTTLARTRLSPDGTLAFAAELGSYQLTISTPGRPALETTINVGGPDGRLTLQLPSQ